MNKPVKERLRSEFIFKNNNKEHEADSRLRTDPAEPVFFIIILLLFTHKRKNRCTKDGERWESEDDEVRKKRKKKRGGERLEIKYKG